MKDFLLIVFILITICFCVYELVQLIMYDTFLKRQSKDFDKLLEEILKEAKEDKDEKKIAKKTTAKKTKKSEKKEEK